MKDQGQGVPGRSAVVRDVFLRLRNSVPLGRGWPGGDWPVRRAFSPPALEVVVGAVLTQGTNWKNVEKVLDAMAERGLVSAAALLAVPLSELEALLRPSGYYRLKSRRLRALLRFVADYPGDFFREVEREELLEVHGVGPETADSILLYARNRPAFVVDAYTVRLFSRLGLLDSSASYRKAQALFDLSEALDPQWCKLYHALIVEHSKETCRKIPLCGRCVLREICSCGRGSIRHRTRESGC